MSKYVPDDLKNMSKGELLEVALIMHEENVRLVQAKHKESLETISDYVLELMQSAEIENFSTNRLSTSDGRSIELTLRYVDGETPADQLARVNERVKELESDLKIALSDKTLDLVRCGIGGNYGGDCYETAMLKYHSPLVELKEQLRKEQE